MLRGNRELLLDRGFESLAGCRVLADATVVDLHGERTLLMHGDALCTRDVWYQRFRALMESAAGRHTFLALPRIVRLALARGLRPLMRRSTSWKPPDIIDVDADAVAETMRRHGVRLLIHGHTHRPGRYPVALDNSRGTRIVLGDWYSDQEMVLVCDGARRELLGVRELLRQEV
jgi:UDP-2,3-diacylglucosamine hydrolase